MFPKSISIHQQGVPSQESPTPLATFATIEDADAPIPPIVDFVVPQHWVAVRLDPDPSHGVVKDLVELDDAQPTVVNQNSAILSAPDLVFRNGGVTARPATQNISSVDRVLFSLLG